MVDVIMVVDDEPVVLSFITELLTVNGYKVEGHTNGIDAYHAFQSQPVKYKLIITDQTMPSMPGNELIKKIRGTHNIPTILCSGDGDNLNKSTAIEQGVSEFLSKPFESKHLLGIVRDTFNRSD